MSAIPELNLTRTYGPLGRYFSAEAEAVADLMMQRPVWLADELKLRMAPAAYAKGERATIALPDGRIVRGYVSSRGPSHLHAELMFAIVGTDVGAPTAPYLFIKDRGLVFSPAPFADARSASPNTGRHDMGSQSHLQRLTNATTLGAIEPFVRLTNKTDDHALNRVYAPGGFAALIDNAIPTIGSLHSSVKRMVRMARSRCRFGDRHAAYHAARDAMAGRIIGYDDDRLSRIDAYLAQAVGINVPDIARRVRCNLPFVGGLKL